MFNPQEFWDTWEILRQQGEWSLQFIAIVMGVILLSAGIRRLTQKQSGQIRSKGRAQAHFLGPVLVWTVGLIMILTLLKVDWTTLAAVAAAASLGITISIGELLQNAVGGIANAASDVFREGENLEVDGHIGTVEEKGLLSTTLVTVDGVKLIVPNWKLLKEPVKNFTREKGFRLRVRIPIDEFDFDSDQVLRVLNGVAKDAKWAAHGRQGFAQFEEIGPSANIFYAYAWIERREQAIPKTGQFMKELTDALTDANISYGETSFIASRFVNVVQSDQERPPTFQPQSLYQSPNGYGPSITHRRALVEN